MQAASSRCSRTSSSQRAPLTTCRSSAPRAARTARATVGETAILLHPPLPLAGVSIETMRECQQNDKSRQRLGSCNRGELRCTGTATVDCQVCALCAACVCCACALCALCLCCACACMCALCVRALCLCVCVCCDVCVRACDHRAGLLTPLASFISNSPLKPPRPAPHPVHLHQVLRRQQRRVQPVGETVIILASPLRPC